MKLFKNNDKKTTNNNMLNNNALKKFRFCKKLYRFWLKIKKLTRIALFFVGLSMSSVLPQNFASAYEYTCYARTADSTSKILAAHYANMITFAYNVAALSTVVLVSLFVVLLYKEIKTPNYYKTYFKAGDK